VTWLVAIALAGSVFAALWALKVPRGGREAIGAAIMVGIAGYAFQASPDLPGAPRAAAERISGDPAALVADRKALSGKEDISGNNYVIIGDALARHGQYADAAGVLLGAVDKHPDDAESWLALANALVGHAEGTLSPAALYAFRRAMQAAPDHPGPPFFLGLALASSGRYAEARATWQRLLDATPADAPWRTDLERRLALLTAFTAEEARAGTNR